MTTDLFSLFSLFSQGDSTGEEWPAPPGKAAFSGLAGELVAEIEPYTEADPAAVLASVVVAFGNACGSGPHFMVGATRHYPREFVVLVGRSSKARKGDSFEPVRQLFGIADPEWAFRIAGGLSSGEGLIFAVRDRMESTKDGQPVVVDEGVADKRLLVIEPEMARVMAVAQRQGNTLSPVIRAAWDSGDLRVMTRTSPITSTGSHISLLCHITMEELRRELTDTAASNGFANRFLWLAVKRSKLLPEPEPFEGLKVHRLAGLLRRALQEAKEIGPMVRDAGAANLWRSVYPDLAAERDGLTGSLTARAEAHVLRLSMIYALLDRSDVITVEHLTAALELWAYAERSIAHIFADAIGDPVADAILRSLKATTEMTRSDIAALFGRHESGDRIALALRNLQAQGLVEMGVEETGGRPRELWRVAG